jgi:hypothetical protein
MLLPKNLLMNGEAIRVALITRSIPSLEYIAIHYGFTQKHRRKAWSIILGLPTGSAQLSALPSANELMTRHSEARQVQLDVDRSMFTFPTSMFLV